MPAVCNHSFFLDVFILQPNHCRINTLTDGRPAVLAVCVGRASATLSGILGRLCPRRLLPSWSPTALVAGLQQGRWPWGMLSDLHCLSTLEGSSGSLLKQEAWGCSSPRCSLGFCSGRGWKGHFPVPVAILSFWNLALTIWVLPKWAAGRGTFMASGQKEAGKNAFPCPPPPCLGSTMIINASKVNFHFH